MKKSLALFTLISFLIANNSIAQSILLSPEPSSNLQISGESPTLLLRLEPNTTGGIKFTNTQTEEPFYGFWFNDFENKLKIGEDETSDAFVIDAGSNRLGLGTDIPLAKLHIHNRFIDNTHLLLTGTVPEIKFGNTSNVYHWKIASIASSVSPYSYFEIRENGETHFSINGEGNVGIGVSYADLEEKLEVKGGNIKLEAPIPMLKMKSTLLSSPVGGMSFYDNSNSLQASFKYDGGVFRINKNDPLTGLNIKETVGVNDEPEDGIALSVQGKLTNTSSNESTLQIKSLSNKMLIDGRSIKTTNSTLFLNGGDSEDVEIGLSTGSGEVILKPYTRIGGSGAPAVKTRLLVKDTSINSGVLSVVTGVLDYKDVLSVSILVDDSGLDKSIPPGNSDPNYFYDFEVLDNLVVLRNIGSSLRGETAKIFLTYTH